jgi:hypothetical protein
MTTLPVDEGGVSMGPSTLVENLRSFDSHERGLLLQWATDQPFRVGAGLCSAVHQAIGIRPSDDALVAMDYTLDWLYAAIRATLGDDHLGRPQPRPSNGELTASPEDVDLLVAWEDSDGPHLVLIEAKGFTGWSNAQLHRKVMRLAAIFAGDLRRRFDVHLLLAGPTPSDGLNVDTWPAWTRPGNRTQFLPISDPCALRGTALRPERAPDKPRLDSLEVRTPTVARSVQISALG